MICLYCCLLLFQSDQYICYAQQLEEIGESFVGEYNVFRKISIYLYAIACSKNTEISEILIELAFFSENVISFKFNHCMTLTVPILATFRKKTQTKLTQDRDLFT